MRQAVLSPAEGGTMEVRFCPRCGTQRLPEARFCGACGLPYDGLEPAEAATGAESQPGAAEPAQSSVAFGEPPAIEPGALELVSAESSALQAPGTPKADDPGSESGWTEPGWSDQDLIRAIHATEGRTRRLASVYFASGGMFLVGAAAVATAFGIPRPASGFIPLNALEDVIARPADYVPLLVALGAATVGLAVAELCASRAATLATAVAILLVAGLTAGGIGIALLGRIAYDATGAVLPGPILLISGAAAFLSAALVAAVIRD